MSKTKSEDIFVDGEDPFDPAEIERFEKNPEKFEEDAASTARQILDRRKAAYARVFSHGHTDQADLDIVMTDLAHFCRAFRPTFDARDGVHAETLMKIKEGRREVVSRIMDFSRLSSDALFLKYTDATYK